MTPLAPGAHPSPEEVDAVLDHPGALLEHHGQPDDVGDRSVAAHLERCGSCQEVAGSLREVRRLLRDEGRRTPAPPVDLPERLGAAIARASGERQGLVVPLHTAASDSVGPRAGDRAGRRSRDLPRWVAVAAGIAVLGGAAVTATQLNGADSTSVFAGGGGADSAAEAAPESGVAAAAGAVSTGTDYRRANLEDQVGNLLSTAANVPLTSAQGGASAGNDEAGPAEESAEGGESGGEARADALVPDADEPLVDPAGLAGCLEAIGAGGAVPLAVDLASFEGEDAAVLALPGATADQVEVWVVARDCRPGADGLLEFQRISAP